jgi:carbon-monoxide dehydrogenase iron sulfur subunit
MLACAVKNSRASSLSQAIQEFPLSRSVIQVRGIKDFKLAFSCQRCKQPLCVSACISGARTQDPYLGLLIDFEACVGCRMCIMVCPFDANVVLREKVICCDLCKDIEGDPYCIRACPTAALSYSFE